MIRSYLQDERGHSADALSVYDGLSELASDKHSETFTVSISQIAERAGVSYKTASKALNRFESLKLIEVQRNLVEGTKEHAPSTYTMLGTPDLTLGKQNQNCLPKGIKNRKNLKNDDNTRTHARTREIVATQSANEQSSSSILVSNLEEAKKHSLWPQFENYCRSRPNGSPTLKGWNTWLPKQSQTKGLPIAQRNKMINKLNERKARIMRTPFPDGKFAPWAEEELEKIQRALSKL